MEIRYVSILFPFWFLIRQSHFFLFLLGGFWLVSYGNFICFHILSIVVRTSCQNFELSFGIKCRFYLFMLTKKLIQYIASKDQWLNVNSNLLSPVSSFSRGPFTIDLHLIHRRLSFLILLSIAHISAESQFITLKAHITTDIFNMLMASNLLCI